jgi:uncharacterized protein YceK
MKPLFLSLTALLLSGCATVSMVSKQAVVEAEAAQEQSEVRKQAKAFEARAEDQGWVSQNGGLAGLANMLFGAGEGQARSSYAERVSASADRPQLVFGKVASDADAAASELADLDRLAVELLNSGKVERADLISFEGALVTAQKCYRSFSEAAGIAEARDDDGLDDAETALKSLAGAIDAARSSADRMADAYSADSASEAQS